MSSLFDKLNLAPAERRLVVIVGIVIFVVLNFWLVIPEFGEWAKNEQRTKDASAKLQSFKTEIAKEPAYKKELKELENQGGYVATEEAALRLSQEVNSQAALSGVTITSITPLQRQGSGGKTNAFFEEASVTVNINTSEKELLDFLFRLADKDMLIRARVACRTATDIPERAPRPTRDGEAYVLYVRGHYLFLRAAHGGRTEDLLVSRTLFEQALQRDPDFALAHAGLSNFFAVAAVRNILRPFKANFDRAIELSHHTLALDPHQAIPHVHFAVQAMYLDSRWDVAEQELARAVALDPLYAEGRRLRGIQLGAMGRRAEAIAELREAVRLEPQIAFFRYALASALMDVRDYAAALMELHRALELDPGYAAARERLVRCHERQGRFADAIAERRRRGEVVTDFETAFDAEGPDGYRKARANELRETIRMLEARLGVSPLENASDILNPLQLRLALAHAELGEWDEALAWEEHAALEQPGRRQWFLTHPDLEPLHPRDRSTERDDV